MKKLKNILASLLCAAVIFGCQYNVADINKRNIPTDEQYIPPEALKQQDANQQPEQANNAGSSPVKIALLVPLSGNYKDLGQGMLNAAQLALFRIGDPNLTILPIDTKNSPDGANQAAKEAIENGAKIILGPIFSSEAKAISTTAAEKNIPVISFSNDKSLAGTGVFAIGAIPEQQVRRIVNFAITNGINDFAALLPSDAYGAAANKEIQQIASNQKNVSIIKNEIYQADNKGRVINLDEHVKAAFGKATAASANSSVAMLITAGSSTTSQIFRSLGKFKYDTTRLQFIGTDQWNNPELLANPLLKGALFTALPTERRKDFEDNFKETYGYDAPKLSGLAYDGVALSAVLAKDSGGNGFSRESLTNPRGFIGVDGIFRLQENGLAERGFAVMSVKGGRAVVVDSAPTSFSDVK